MNRWLRLLGTWMGSGCSPWAPGTMGTLASLPLWCGLRLCHNVWLYGAVWVLLCALAIPVSTLLAQHWGEHDPKAIVLDEVVGMGIPMAMVSWSWIAVLTAFILFRLFDVLKPWPVSWCDQQLPGGWGIVMDDVMAGLLALCFLIWMGLGLADV